ncbi:MAG: sensor histidine kinase [Acidimicrobiales bacterium]
MIVLVALVAGALVAAGIGTLLIARRSARQDATSQLLKQASVLSGMADQVRTKAVLRVVDVVLQRQGGEVIGISGAGAVLAKLPGNVTLTAAQAQHVLQGRAVSGWTGSTAFAAVPVSPTPFYPRLRGGSLAVVLTRSVGSLGPSWVYFVLVTGLILAVAVLLALWLSQRITSPLVAATAVTERIARGEMSARIATTPGNLPELVTLADSINAMAERLEHSRERERQMLLSVSHDLRTPLTSIRGYAEAVADGVAEDASKAARVIVSESRRLERLVADLLDLARLEMSALSLHLVPTDAVAIVRATTDGFLPRATAAGIALRADVPPTAVDVVADPDRLAQVVANLVENALTYAASGVSVALVAGSGGVTITVEDDGPGVAAGDLSRIFERYYQADRRSSGGSGLGLAIVAELLQAMGGHVEALSPASPAGGTRMIVVLRAGGPPSMTEGPSGA